MSDQNIEPELTVGEIIKLYMSYWRMFAVVSVVLFGLSLIVYAVKIPYVASAVIIINDSQNSSLQAFSNQFFGLSKSLQENKKGNSLLSKHIEYLKTREFYESFLKKIEIRGQSNQITLDERHGFDEFKSKHLTKESSEEQKNETLRKLGTWIQVKQSSDFEVEITASTPSKSLSLFLVNTAAELASEALKQRELTEIQRVEEFMTKQMEEADDKMASFSQELADLQNKNGGVLPLASQEKMGDYVSELLVRSNEIKLKMAENRKTIQYLEKGRSAQRESALYGVGGQIEALKIENNLLAEKLGQVNSSVDQLKKDAKTLPFAAAMVEDLKKKAELEFNRYKELNSGLAKLDAQKLSIDTRFEFLEKARWENTVPKVGVLALGLVSILLSQLFGSLVIYFRYLWNPRVISGEASRNLYIYDNHSGDPRVIIENSKIKFSLKTNEKVNESETGGEPPKKVAWSILNVGQGTDITQ